MADWNPNLVPSKLTKAGLTCVGQFHVDTPASTSITSGTPTKLLGTTLPGPLKGWTHSSGRLTYNGSKRTVWALVTADIKPDNVAMDAIVYIALNGTEIARTVSQRRLVAAGQSGVAALNAYIEVQRGDYLEVFVDSDVSNSVTSDNYILSVAG